MSKEKELQDELERYWDQQDRIEQTLERLERYLIYLNRGLICIYPHGSPERDTLHGLRIHDKLCEMDIPENIRKIWDKPVSKKEQCTRPVCKERRKRNKDNKCKWWKPMRSVKKEPK